MKKILMAFALLITASARSQPVTQNDGRILTFRNTGNTFYGSGANLTGIANITSSGLSFTNVAGQASTNYAVTFGTGGIIYNRMLGTAANVCFQTFSGGPGPVTYTIIPTGTNILVLWPTNMPTLITNNLTLNGTNWSYTLTNKANAAFVWSALATTNISAGAMTTNIIVSWGVTP